MSERKVLNKYYPPDFDPTKIPKLRLPKNRTFNIRLMAPFNMRCNTCGEYIYKGKKFNSRKETVENETYLGLHIYRFYIKCPKCIAEISFKTDPRNTDYELEAGATRNFEALRTAERLALKEQQEKEDEEANNPMKLLENRTKASQREMDTLETLEDLKEIRRKQECLKSEDVLKAQQRLPQIVEVDVDEEERELEEEIKAKFGGSVKKYDEKLKRKFLGIFDNDAVPPVKVAKIVKNFSALKNNPSLPRDGISNQFAEIRASIKPKADSQSSVKKTDQDSLTILVSPAEKLNVIEKSSGSSLKLISYSDSDDDD